MQGMAISIRNQILKLPNGLMKILVDGTIQGKIKKFTDRSDFFEAEVEIVIPKDQDHREMNALIRQMTNLFKEYVKINRSNCNACLILDS